MLLTACASSDGGIADKIGGGDSLTESGGAAPEFIDPSDPDIARAIVLADQLVGALGDDDTAAEALLTAFAAGYSSPQVLDAVEANALLADGTVSGVEPDGPPLDLSNVEPKRRRRAEGDTDERTPIERFRDAANELGAVNNPNVGNFATLIIIVLAVHGLTAEEIIEVLVLGEVEYVRDGVCYRQLIDNVVLECDARSDDEPATDETIATDPTPPADDAPVDGATYEGDLEGLVSGESNIIVTISPEGTVSGTLTATEELDNYLDSVDVICGVFDEDEDCSDSVVECPATVHWNGGLGGLEFVGTAPDEGTVAGTITITLDTTPRGCGEPSTDTQTLQIEATVSPDGAQITSPFVIDLTRT